MGGMFRALMNLPLFKSVLRPITRVIVGLVAIPAFRFIMRKVFRLQDLDDELEKDLEQWFRGALLLLAASANMEHLLFGWMDRLDWMDRMDWLTMGLRLMLAIGVIEAMPDQELFAVIHPGPPKIKPGRSAFKEFWRLKYRFMKGFVCQHLNRSSPVLAMMTAIVGAQLLSPSDADYAKLARVDDIDWSYCQQIGAISPVQIAIGHEIYVTNIEAAKDFYRHDLTDMKAKFQRNWERWMVGWTCYLLAITQYLIIGLVTSRDRAMDVLSEFDKAVAQRRRELIEEFHIDNGTTAPTKSEESVQAPPPEPDSSPATADEAGDDSA